MRNTPLISDISDIGGHSYSPYHFAVSLPRLFEFASQEGRGRGRALGWGLFPTPTYTHPYAFPLCAHIHSSIQLFSFMRSHTLTCCAHAPMHTHALMPIHTHMHRYRHICMCTHTYPCIRTHCIGIPLWVYVPTLIGKSDSARSCTTNRNAFYVRFIPMVLCSPCVLVST